tara:strand:- start:1648 stop:1902 length:255 start_codon:yes stop_codon:yes gene_type:complete
MMNKPKYIEARYSAFLSWDLEALDIDWDKIKDYSISRGDLEIEYKDGTKQVEENWGDISVDYKHNFEEALVLDESWNRIEELCE